MNTAAVDGWLFLMMGIFMVGFTPIFLRAHFAASLFIITADIFFMGSAFAALITLPTLGLISIWTLPIICASAIWQVLSGILNTCFGRTVLSLGPAWIKS
jgi:hypothetical protein